VTLKGRTVLVTRPFGQAAALIQQLDALGAEPLPFAPLLLEPQAAALAALPQQLREADWVIPVSPSALDLAADAIKHAELTRLKFAGVGASSAGKLAALTGREALHPDGELSDSAALLACPELADMHGQRVLIIRGENGRAELADGLAARGAQVAFAELYQRRDATLDWAAFDKLAAQGKLAAAIVTSGEIAERLFQLAGPARAKSLQSLLYSVPHPRIAERLRALGAQRIVTTPADDAALIAGLQTWFSHHAMSDTQTSTVDPIPTAPAARRNPVNLALAAALLALGIAGWQYYETRLELTALQQQLKQKQAEAGGAARELRGLTEQALAASRGSDAKIARLEEQMTVASGQYATLNGMYQELTKNRADWLLSEVEHTLAIASQELQLTGNVNGTIVALEGVNARLGQFDRPQLIGVKRALGRDLETLKALPKLDSVGLTVNLDRLLLAVEQLPLVVDLHQLEATTSKAQPASGQPWWERLARDVAQSLGELVHIRRMDKPEALLLAPEQAFSLRKNLKLRLLDARLALHQRDGATFRANLNAARSYVNRYFDRDALQTRQWLASLAEFDKAPLDVKLPDLSASLNAAREAQGKS